MKLIYGIVLSIALVIFVAFMVTKEQGVMESALPPRTVCPSIEAASIAATTYAGMHGGEIVSVAGTGSMAPYIPAAAHGLDPSVVVAYVVTAPSLGYADIKKGDLVLYFPKWTPSQVLHQAAQKDAGGWIMSGLNNAHYEAEWRVTPENFNGIIAASFIFQ